ncbi:MAG: acyltransferase [Phycisphaerae bacterium]
MVRYAALRHNRLVGLYRKLCRPDGLEYAEYIRRHGRLYSIGSKCRIVPGVVLSDPELIRLGNNVSLSSCALLAHDGSIAVLNEAYGVKLDSVGKIDIRDNVFVGFGAVIMPNVTIGPNAIVAAGAVVTHDVAEGDIVAGVPARPIGRVEKLVEKLHVQTKALPWAELIEARTGPYDSAIESELIRRRVEYFYPNPK